jgi:hypothetical protein
MEAEAIVLELARSSDHCRRLDDVPCDIGRDQIPEGEVPSSARATEIEHPPRRANQPGEGELRGDGIYGLRSSSGDSLPEHGLDEVGVLVGGRGSLA